jgi:NAD(P)H dehydrogenase (quinone)
MKVAVIYHSVTGNTQKIAEIIADGMKLDQTIDVRCMPVEHVDFNFLEETKAVIFGCPTYCGSFSWQMKQWLDTNHGKLAGKLGSVFATENYLGGGADFAEMALIGHLLVHGMLIYSSGVSEGDPFTHFGAVCIKDGDEVQKERARIFGKRITQKAKELFGSAPKL